jgi:heptaprenyl diphosphate synthase
MTKWFEDQILTRQLNQVKLSMVENLRSGDQYLNGSLDYLMMSGGKMLRPAFLLIGSRFNKISSKRENDLIKLATAMETLHIATLIHDDIIDEAKLRRDQESIQYKYSKEYAVYMGDYLLSQCFLMLSELNIPRELAVRLAKVVSKICMGEIKQYTKRYDVNITPMEYIRIASGKTAALFAVSLTAGGYMSKVSKDTLKLLGRIGYEIGMAFQLVDDLLDYTGDEEKVGKDLRSDLIRGYYSMPVIFALRDTSSNQSEIRKKLEEGLASEDIPELIDWIRATGGIEKTRELAIKYHQRAETLIEKLPDNEGKNILREMLPKLLERMR